jgi:hypothetical protein
MLTGWAKKYKNSVLVRISRYLPRPQKQLWKASYRRFPKTTKIQKDVNKIVNRKEDAATKLIGRKDCQVWKIPSFFHFLPRSLVHEKA